MVQWISPLCCCLGRSHPKRSIHDYPHPAIDIYTDLSTDPPSSRLATLSLDPGYERNLISRPLVNEVLGIEIHPLDKEGGNVTSSTLVNVDGQQVSLQGYVDIQWNINSVPRKIYNTRFYIPNLDNPSFDARLAQQTIQDYRLLKSKPARRR